MRILCLCLFFLAYTTGSADPAPRVKFIENKNQWRKDLHFVARVAGGNMVVQPGRFSYYFVDRKQIEEIHDRSHVLSNRDHRSDEWQQDQWINGQAVHATFLGANTNAIPQAFGQSSEYYNYFIGSDASKWGTRAYAYDGMLYQSLYTGVDLKVYSSGDHPKYDFIIAPGADPSQIKIAYDGADELKLENGNLYAMTSLVNIIEKRPFAYQIINGERKEIMCEFNVEGNVISFCFPENYDVCYPLVIDPLLIFSTFSGSTADNWGSTATPGEKGNLYSSGVTSHYVGGTFPATPGSFQVSYGGLFDVSILKYDSLGSQMLYASYLGGSESESPHSLIMNKDEELVVLGTTSSDDFPVSALAYDQSFNGGTTMNHTVLYTNGSDIFISRVSKDGTQLLASTYLGGQLNDGLNPNQSVLNKNYGDQLRGDIITDEDGNIYVSSVTASPDFPGVNGFDVSYNGGETDAVLVKFPADLSAITWSAFIGGAGTDASHTLKLDHENNIFIAGGTNSTNFPVTTGAFQTVMKGDVDGWIAKIGSLGDVVHNATYTGTVQFDQIYFLDLNEHEEVYVYGQTAGDFLKVPAQGVYHVNNGGQFLQKFSNDLSTVQLSTVFGTGKGSPDISPTAFIVNECNNVYMAGWGGSLNQQFGGWSTSTIGLETTTDALQRTTSGSDFYFIVLTADATELLYATFLGGPQSRTHVDGGTSRFDEGGIVYHAVCSGCNTDGSGPKSDFPTTAGAWSRTNNSNNCNNAAFKFDLSSLRARVQTNSVRLDMPGLNKVCLPDLIVFQNRSIGGEIFEWDLGDGTYITKMDTSHIVHEYKKTGRYQVWLKAIDQGTCKVRDSTFTFVDVFTAAANIQDDDDMCADAPYQLFASGGSKYAWTSDDGTFQSSQASPIISPKDTTVYYITITESNGCVHKDTVQINVIPVIAPDFEIERNADCFSTPAVRVRNLTDSLREGDKTYFDFGDGNTLDADEAFHQFEKDGEYNVKLVAVREFCVTEKVVTMPFRKLKLPNVITPGIKDDKNDTFTIQFGEEIGATPSDFDYKVSIVIYNRWGNEVYRSDDYRYDWSGEGLASGIYFYEVTVDGHATCKNWVHLIKED